jgi:hypothetical protein
VDSKAPKINATAIRAEMTLFKQQAGVNQASCFHELEARGSKFTGIDA